MGMPVCVVHTTHYPSADDEMCSRSYGDSPTTLRYNLEKVEVNGID